LKTLKTLQQGSMIALTMIIKVSTLNLLITLLEDTTDSNKQEKK
jgi:hypothetical protein